MPSVLFTVELCLHIKTHRAVFNLKSLKNCATVPSLGSRICFRDLDDNANLLIDPLEPFIVSQVTHYPAIAGENTVEGASVKTAKACVGCDGDAGVAGFIETLDEVSDVNTPNGWAVERIIVKPAALAVLPSILSWAKSNPANVVEIRTTLNEITAHASHMQSITKKKRDKPKPPTSE